MYSFRYSKKLKTILKKLSKKDKKLYEKVLNKIDEVINCYDLSHYKNLRYDMKDSKRAHIGHFVLVFQFDKKNNSINFDNFKHHDDVYKKRG